MPKWFKDLPPVMKVIVIVLALGLAACFWDNPTQAGSFGHTVLFEWIPALFDRVTRFIDGLVD